MNDWRTLRRRLTRRHLVGIGLGGGLVGLLASCAPASAPAPTAAPAATTPPKPAAPTTAPAPAPTPAATAAPKAAPKQREKLVVRLDWFPVSYHAPFYVALNKGWYDEQALDVEVGEAKGSGQAALLVSTGQATFGHVEGGALVKALVAGQPLKSVALAFGKTPLGYAYAKDLDIRTPKDLEGKTFGAVPFAATFQLWPAFAAINGIDVNKVNVVNVDPENSIQAIATKKVDFIDGAVGEEDFLITQAGRPAATFGLAEFGLNYVGHAIVATAATIQQKPDVIRRFLDVTLRGYDYTRANEKDALEIFLKLNKDAKADLAANQLKASAPLWSNPSGAQTEQQWQSTIDLVAKYGKLEKTPKTSDIYTNDFLPKR